MLEDHQGKNKHQNQFQTKTRFWTTCRHIQIVLHQCFFNCVYSVVQFRSFHSQWQWKIPSFLQIRNWLISWCKNILSWISWKSTENCSRKEIIIISQYDSATDKYRCQTEVDGINVARISGSINLIWLSCFTIVILMLIAIFFTVFSLFLLFHCHNVLLFDIDGMWTEINSSKISVIKELLNSSFWFNRLLVRQLHSWVNT